MAFLECKKLKKTYSTKDSRTVALTNFNLAFPNNGIVAIQGKSGSGKSTLLCLLSMLEQPDSGSILFEDVDYATMSKRRKNKFAREDSSFVFQHYGLFEEKTVWENIMLPLRMIGDRKSQTKESIAFLLSHFGLEGFEKRKVSSLSGGEKQRVALIRALVKAPKVLFADEPTGALDEKNGEEVMKMLSSMSGSCLIVMVSHNTDLVKRYADRIITLKDGVKVRSETIRERDNAVIPPKKKGRSSSWCLNFLKSFLQEDMKRNVLTVLSGLLGMLSILSSVGYFLGSPMAINDRSKHSLEYTTSYLSKKETIAVSDSPLSLVRQVKPTLEEAKDFLKEFKHVTIEDDYSYFLPSHSMFKLNGEEFSDGSFVPIYDITLVEYGYSFLKKGKNVTIPSLETCYVNDVFANNHHFEIGDKIELSLQIPIQTAEINDLIELNIPFVIQGVAEEFPFLNTPKIYYSFPLFKEHLQTIRLPKFEEAFQGQFCLKDFIEIYPNEVLGNGYQIYFRDPFEMKTAFDLMSKQGDMVLESFCYTSASSFTTLSEAFQMCLLLLLGISLLGIIGITGMNFLSLFIKRKQEIALLFSLGATRGEVISIYLLEAFILSLIYTGLSVLIYPYLQQGFNYLLNLNFGIPNLVNLPSFFLFASFKVPFMALIVGASLLISLFSCALPIIFSMRKGLRKELRDE